MSCVALEWKISCSHYCVGATLAASCPVSTVCVWVCVYVRAVWLFTALFVPHWTLPLYYSCLRAIICQGNFAVCQPGSYSPFLLSILSTLPLLRFVGTSCQATRRDMAGPNKEIVWHRTLCFSVLIKQTKFNVLNFLQALIVGLCYPSGPDTPNWH